MCLGCALSFRYSRISLSLRARPNHVLHQNRNGISTSNQAVRKNSSRLRVDIRERALAGAGVVSRGSSAVMIGIGWVAIRYNIVIPSEARDMQFAVFVAV